MDAELFSEQELTCSICLDLFSEPVSTPCGHNFCQGCIGGYWASSAVCSCPLCKREFEERPELSINRVFAQIALKYQQMRYGEAAQARQENPSAAAEPKLEPVFCDVCSGVKKPALRSCLTCTASYCDTHLQPHLHTPFYSTHRLLPPHDALRGRTCREHGRLLEVFCRTDQRCICAICVLEEHRTHTTVSVQTERALKQRLLGKMELELQVCVDRRSAQLAELKTKLLTVQRYSQAEQAEVEQLLSDMSSSIQRIRSELVGGIQDKREAVIGRGQRMVSQQESKLAQLQEHRARLEAQAISDDHIGFLQSFQAASGPMQDEAGQEAEQEAELTLRFSLGDVKAALGEIRDRLEDIRSGEMQYRHSVSTLAESESMMSVRSMRRKDWSLKDLRRIKTGHKKVKGYLEDVSLNPVTAYPFLILSEDRKQLKRGEKLQFYRNNTQRYDVWSCVLAKESFQTGRHYWEVSVGENRDWKLGVVCESAQRKGLFDMTPAAGYYALWWSGNHLRALTAPSLSKVKVAGHLRRVGVYLDCEEGQVIFYNAKSGAELYCFSGPLSEKMLPLFGTADKEVPMVLCSAAD